MANITDTQLAADDGSALVGHIAQGSGAVARTVQDRLRDALNAKDFGAVGDGTTDDTPALIALLAAMQTQGKPGLLGSEGQETRYSIECGALEWTFHNSPTVDAPGVPGPQLLTAGRVVLVARSAIEGSENKPFLSIHNDPGENSGGRYIHGGHVGDLVFEDTTGDVAPGRHGISLYGVQFMDFGVMFSNHLKGDLLRIESPPFATVSTGDGWHVFANRFRGLVTWQTDGWTLNNQSLSQFFNFNTMDVLYNSEGEKGLWNGPGAANLLVAGSVYACRGWAIDWTVSPTSSTQSNTIIHLELDSPEMGIRIDGPQAFSMLGVRVVHRYDDHPRQIADSADIAWPKTAIQLGGSGASTAAGKIRCYNYLKNGIENATKAKLGNLTDFADDSTLRRNQVEHNIGYVEGGFTYPPEKYVVNVDPGALGNAVTIDGEQVLRGDSLVHARINPGNWPTSYVYSDRIDFAFVEIDAGGDYSIANKEFTAPVGGVYAVNVRLMASGSAGDLIRIGLLVIRPPASPPVAPEREAHYRAQGSGNQTFALDTTVRLEKGEKIAVIAYAPTALPFGSGSTAAQYCNSLEVKLL